MPQVIHYELFEQLVENQFDLDIGFQQFCGPMKAFAYGLGIERVFIFVDFLASQYQLESFSHRE